jgi:phosphoribosylanthranilate isomerase
MNRVLAKICGLTREEDVISALECGADAIGFVFTQSPRQITIETAVRLAALVPAEVLRIGLFLNQPRSEIEQVLDAVTLDVLQFHGNETEADCLGFDIPWLKAVAMTDAGSARQAEQDYPNAKGLLLDSHTPGGQGGSGKVFDWSLIRPLGMPVWLAGGLTEANVAGAIKSVRPYAVDVSSGVESAPGIKDPNRMAAFIEAVREIDNETGRGSKT